MTLGQVSAEKIAAWEASAYPNAVLNLANAAGGDIERRQRIAVYESIKGKDAADRLRRDVWAAIQEQRRAA